jgi:hypothetical protein
LVLSGLLQGRFAIRQHIKRASQSKIRSPGRAAKKIEQLLDPICSPNQEMNSDIPLRNAVVLADYQVLTCLGKLFLKK